MITRVLEWYRIVNLQPTKEVIELRTAAVQELVKSLDDADAEMLAGVTAAVVAGFEVVHTQDSDAVKLVYTAIHEKDVTVSQDLSENSLELRAVAAIAIGELMARNEEKEPDDVAVSVALLFESGLGLRTRPSERFLQQLIDELAGLATRTLERAAQPRRRRGAGSLEKLLAVEETPDPATGIKALTKAVRKELKEILQQAAVDREELEILWWIFAGKSITTGKQISSMPAGAAALAAGSEVAAICLLPPPTNADAFVLRSIEHVKKIDSKRTLEKILEETDAQTREALISNEATDLPRKYPTLFPLSWLCQRLRDSGGASGWGDEFKLKTGLDSSQSLDANAIGVQAFRERIALRQCAE